MSTAKGYHDALLTLSGNPVFAAARDALLASISDNELLDVITHGLKTGSPRETLNAIATRLLDGLATAGRVRDAVAPVDGKHGGGDGGDDDDSGDGGGRKDSGGSSGHAAQRGDARWPVQTALQKPTETPTTKGTRSSTADNKRTGDCLMQDGKKRRYVSPDPMDDEEDIVKAEKWVENKAANDVAKETEQASSSATKTASSTSETDSDTDTSLNQDTPWKRTQKLSVMPDLQLVDSDDEDDEDYSGDVHPIPLPTPHIKKARQIPDVFVSFWTPGPQGYEHKKLTHFPISFVKFFVRKFNEDYLKTSANRNAYRKTTEKYKGTDKCMRSLLGRNYKSRGPECIPGHKGACRFCSTRGNFCVGIMPHALGKPCLVVYPLRPNDCKDWRSMDFWVKKSVG